ncbi:ASKHA domain-containing protein [Jannaschia sp. LMIT008]|uniref:ASKHA domain-containing protein n=1 Tax=Jannaschia maritima TaxID=3032585 RepID=UPI0028113439|nr:ASKHA domain-containing protein [Jannaschia sp. LMIT008]
MADCLIVFTPSGKRGRVPSGTTVLQAARRFGVDLDSVCGGRGICSKCQCSPGIGTFAKHGVTSRTDALSEPNAVEARYEAKRGLPPGRRLGCQAEIRGDVVVDVPPESQLHRQVIRKDASAATINMDPATRLHMVRVAEPDMDAPTGDLERLRTALAEQWDLHDLTVPLSVLRGLQRTLRKGGWTVTVAVNHDERCVARIWPGLRTDAPLGLAIDLGSTTIAAHLCDLGDGRVLASGGVMNPQIRFGEDLMSRVSYAMMNPGGAAEMHSVVRAAMADLLRDLAAEVELDPGDVTEAVIVCNPVMHHLLLGIDPVELGQAPFALAASDAMRLALSDVGLDGGAPGGRVYLLPCIAGHVGADAAAVALAEAPDRSEETVLIVDVGTNAELILGNRDRLLACSSPTGPAFEGAQISAGQRAAPGAIERVRIDPATGLPRFQVIGTDPWSDDPGFDATVTGICGSGIIEAVAEMRMAGILDPSGLIGSAEATGSPRCVPDGRTHSFVLWESGDRRIAVTQGDVRAIQLAKSALYAGARLLMDEAGLDRVDRVTLAGAFGAHISAHHALVLGMIPDAPVANVTSAGNAAGHGARVALCDRGARRYVEALVRRITKVETAVAPRFQEHFVAANAIPHATDPFPNLLAVTPLPAVSFGAAAQGGRRRGRRT